MPTAESGSPDGERTVSCATDPNEIVSTVSVLRSGRRSAGRPPVGAEGGEEP